MKCLDESKSMETEGRLMAAEVCEEKRGWEE